MLGNFKLQTLKQKLWAIVAASFVARVIMFFALPSSQPLLPDEHTYSQLARWVSDSKPAIPASGYYEGLYVSSRSITLPTSFLVRAGIGELDASRLISSAYGFLGLVVLVIFVLGVFKKNERDISGYFDQNLLFSLILVFAFFPSHFLWSILGLRESGNEFWLILTFFAAFLLYEEKQKKKFLIGLLIFISIVGTFSSRPKVAWVLVVSLFIFSLFKLRNKVTYLLIVSVFTGLFVGYLATSSNVFVTSDVYIAKNGSTTSKNASKLCKGTKAIIEYKGESYSCVKSGTTTSRLRTSDLAETAVAQIELIPEMQSLNQVNANSKIQRLTCPWDEVSMTGKYACLAYRAPYMTSTFLFRPLPILDTTSLISVIAAIENISWIFMFWLILHRIIKVRKVPFFGQLAPPVIFFSLFLVGAGLYQGNLGTAFRHKSLVLWIVLLLIFMTSKAMASRENPKDTVTS